jgi:hypothetical protein
MDLLNKINHYNESLNEIPYGELSDFVLNMKRNVDTEINKLKNLIHELNVKSEQLSLNILKKNIIVQKKQVFEKCVQTVGGVAFECIIINEISDACRYPHQPCCFRDVPQWFFFSFPEFNQILPVKHIPEFLILQDNKYTKLHYGILEEMPFEQIINSDFACFPFNTKTWNYFNKIPKSKWNLILTQMHVHVSKKTYPITSTNNLCENVKKIKPKNMPVMWAMFIQTYFILFLFRKCADLEHFFT